MSERKWSQLGGPNQKEFDQYKDSSELYPFNKKGIHNFHDREGWMDEKGELFLKIECLPVTCEGNDIGVYGGESAFCYHHSELSFCLGLQCLLNLRVNFDEQDVYMVLKYLSTDCLLDTR